MHVLAMNLAPPSQFLQKRRRSFSLLKLSRFLIPHLQNKPHLKHILDRNPWVVAQHFAQAGDEHVEAAAQKIVLFTIDAFHGVVAAQDVVLV